MKKLYLFMTALFVAIAANAADWYLMGPNYSGWGNGSTDWQLQPTSNANEYSITVDNLDGQFKFKRGDAWVGTPNGNGDVTVSTLPYSGNSLKDSNNFSASSLGKAKITITENGSTYNVKIESAQGGGEETPSGIYYANIKSPDASGNWVNDYSKHEMSGSNDVYTYEYLHQGKGGFNLQILKWENGSQVDYYESTDAIGENITLNAVTTAHSKGGKPWYFGNAKQGSTYVITFNDGTNPTVTLTEKNAVSYPELYLRGQFNSDGLNYKMEQNNGVYTVTVPEISGSFKIADADWSSDNMLVSVTITDNFSGVLSGKDAMTIADGKTLLNATFTFTWSNKSLTVSGTYKEEEVPGEKYYCYFVNSNNWTTPTVWAWVSETDETSCNANTTWPGDAMTQKDGKWYWEAPAGKVPGMILISDNGDKYKRFETNFVNCATYKPNGDIASEEDYARVYFNPGADFYNNTMFNQSNDIYAQLLSQNGTAVGSRTKMTRLTGEEVQLPFFYIDVENPKNYGGIRFETTKPDGSTLSYTSNGCPDYDQERWYMFIYNCGDPAGRDDIDCYTAQTYLTYAEYEERRNGLKPHLFYIGGNIKGLRFWKEAKAAEAKDGVFLFPIGYEESTDADDPYRERSINNMTFKMSWIDADTRQKEYNAKYGTNSTGINNRWWATFNLGLVGPNPAPGQTFDDYMALGYIANLPQLNGNKDGNYSVKYLPNRTRRYSRYNNYNWWVSVEQLKDVDAQHYIIVDTKYKTTALIPFNPRPTLTDVTSGEIFPSQKDLASHEAQLGNALIGSKVAGEARINKANQLQGTAKLKPSEGLPFYNKGIVGEINGKPGYELEYSILMGDEDLEEYDVIGTFPGNPDALSYEIKMKNMTFGAEKKIFVRCTYHDLVNQSKDASGEFFFRSMVEPAEIGATGFDPKAPHAIEGYTPTVKLIRNPDGSWSAHVETEVELDVMKNTEGDALEVYPDFELATLSAGESLRLATTADWHTQPDVAIASAHHTIYESGDYIHNVHNWAEIAHQGTENGLHRYKFNFVFENIAPAGTNMDDPSYTLRARIYAQYPMLIDNTESAVEVTAYRNSDFTDPINAASTLRRKANGTRDAAPSYSLSMIPASTELEFEARKNNLSGITDAEVAEDGEAELYNLQGIRVQGEPAPGIYLRRHGNTTEKVVIR